MVGSQKWQKLATIVAGGMLVFLLSQWIGNQFRRPQNSSAESSAQDSPQAEFQQAEPLDWLPEIAQKNGIRLTASPDAHAVMFVHPESPCWVDVPRAPAGDVEAYSGQGVSEFLGAEACAECHQEIFDSYRQTGHYQSSALASEATVEGRFAPGENRLATNHADLSFEMQRIGDTFYQTVHFRELTKSVPMEIVTGSGHIGQTFLYWVGNSLYQLPISYFRAIEGWSNSPGYHDGTAWFSRPVITKCLECHATYAEPDARSQNSYVRSSLVLGISCERCHGAGRQHVEYHQQNPQAEAKFITHPNQLDSQQNNDLCAQCHFGSGNRKANPPFSFKPGDSVDEHFAIDNNPKQQGGVHSSNQLARLQMSKCFEESASMTCIDCHDPHRNQRGDLRYFSSRCMECHQPEHCGQFEEAGAAIAENCIDCHMPMGQDSNLVFNRPDEVLFPLLRDHYIRVSEDKSVPSATAVKP